MRHEMPDWSNGNPNPRSGCDKDFGEVPIVIPDSQSGDESSNLSSGRKKKERINDNETKTEE